MLSLLEQKSNYIFDRWCSSKKVGSDHAKLRQLMLVEEFKRCINSDVKAFLNEREVENLETAARLADDYALTHKASFVNKPYPRKPYITLNQSKLPLSQNHIPLSPVPKPIPVIQLTIPVQNPNFLVKTKDKIPYPSQFVIIVRKLATLFLNVWH